MGAGGLVRGSPSSAVIRGQRTRGGSSGLSAAPLPPALRGRPLRGAEPVVATAGARMAVGWHGVRLPPVLLALVSPIPK